MSFRAHILDAAALREVAPAALRAYAVAQGWKRTEAFGDHSDVYVLEGADEVIIPGTSSLADYAEVVSKIVAFFANLENRDELKVYRDLATADQDVIRVRAPHAEDDGSIALDAGVDLVVEARNLLLSAACSASDPRSVYRAGSNRDAREYMERVRLGQTEHGSFVVTLLSPVPPSLDAINQPTLWPLPSDDPFERRVTRQLAEGLEAARDAVEKANRGGIFDVFENAVRHGVSANLCDAAAGLIEQGDGLDVSITWARTRSTPEKRRNVIFSPSDADVLREAAKLFRDREPRLDEKLEGYIAKLVREASDEEGQVTLKTFVDERPVSVRIDLSEQEYDGKAVPAHGSRLPVSVRGDLVRDGQRWQLRNPRDLTILEADEDDGPSESAVAEIEN